MRPFRLSRRTQLVLPLLSVLILTGCPEEEDDETNVFLVASSQFGVAGTTPLAVSGSFLVFLADEASSGGQDLNNDGQPGLDEVAIVVNTNTKAEINLGVAATTATWVGSELYVVVDEILDNFEHGGPMGMTDLVLMHWNSTMMAPTFVATLDRSSPLPMVSVGDTLFYASDEMPMAATESSIYAIDKAFPQMPRPVFTHDMVAAQRPKILGAEEGLVLLILDETVEGVALNGDGNADDTHVLVLLDGTGVVDAGGYTLIMRNTELAVSGDASPFRAVSQGANDWLFGFLADERSQEANLNLFDGVVLPASWQVASCAVDDSDTMDEVLHVIRFADWDLDSMTSPPINTGLAGTQRVLITEDAVATICAEEDENDCVFNNDGDADDRMLRWIRINSPTFPFSAEGPARALAVLIALDSGVPGSARAVAELDGAFVIQIDEAKGVVDYDGVPGIQRKLLGWLDGQDASPAWVFNHSVGGSFYATATWMGEQPQKTRLGIAFAETSNSTDLNLDGDKFDAMPTWADLGGSPRRLSFLGRFLATDKDNAGITMTDGSGYFRFSEAENGGDSNGNGTDTDTLLVRVSFASGLATNMGVLNLLARPAIDTEEDGSSAGGAFLFDETVLGFDLNGDMDAADLVPRYFRIF